MRRKDINPSVSHSKRGCNKFLSINPVTTVCIGEPQDRIFTFPRPILPKKLNYDKA